MLSRLTSWSTEFEVDNSRHPISLLKSLRENHGDSLVLEFSRYAYAPQTVFDEREIFEAPILEVDSEWLSHEISSLKPGWELALNSRVMDSRGRILHIPMIDFIGRSCLENYSLFEGVVGPGIAKRMTFFDSGRSFHSYAPILIRPGEWVNFMGRLLLLNLPGIPAVTDARWVGHRLMGGFSALRWSNNSGAYLHPPRAIPFNSVFRPGHHSS